jgi:hypothetical protein
MLARSRLRNNRYITVVKRAAWKSIALRDSEFCTLAWWIMERDVLRRRKWQPWVSRCVVARSEGNR